MSTSANRAECGAGRSWFARALVLGAVTFALLAACGDEATLPTQQPAMALAVDSVSPRASEAGETLELRIVGAGFRSGAVATIERGGAAATAVVAEQTTVVSETELVATVSIGADAVPALYDVVVSNADGVRAAAGGIFTVEEPLPIVVAEAQPREAGQGETREVRIFGSGFREGDAAVWERDGEAYDGVVVQETEFVSAEELIATISVDPEAAVASYDVAVSRPRKRGIGTEVFDILPGIGSELEAMFQFTYDGYRSDSFDVDHTFVLDLATMDPGSWGLTYYVYEYAEQALSAHYLRDDGLLDMMWCWVPGGRVREPGTRPLECWFTPQYNFDTGEYADPMDYTSWVEGDRPGDGSGTVTFTSVTTERLEGTFSITMHVVDWEDWVGSPSIDTKDGAFSLPVVSTYWGDQAGGEPNPPTSGGFSGSWATAINDHGVVTGWAYNGAGAQRAVRWTVGENGIMAGPEELGTLPGSTHQWPTAINNEGVIVGFGYNADPEQTDEVGFIYDGTLRPLTPIENAYSTRPFGINDLGVVVGWSFLSAPFTPLDLRGPVWLNPLDPAEAPIQLPQRGGGRVNWGGWISNAGRIAGFSSVDHVDAGHFQWHLAADGSLSDPTPIALEIVLDMNHSHNFVGTMRQDRTPLLYRDREIIPLHALPGHHGATARALNDPLPGQPLLVVGSSARDSDDPVIRPVVWRVDAANAVTGPTDLGGPNDYTSAQVFAVNARGWIIGVAFNGSWFDGVATLWRPIPGSPRYEIITLSGLGATMNAGLAMRAGAPRCQPRPGRPGRCR